MPLFSFSNDLKEEISAVFHIGSGSVSGYIVKLSKKSNPEIVYSKKVPISFQKNLNLERHFNLMISSLDSVSKDLQKQGLLHLNFTGLRSHSLKKVNYFLSSPWCVSQTKIIKIKKDKSFEVSHELLLSILNEQENKFLSDNSVENSIIIEKKIIEARLNGYKISDIYEKKTVEIELSLFLTSASKNVLEKIKDTAVRYFNFHSSAFHSFALSSFSEIRDSYPEKESFIYLDVHGELTDLSVARDGIFVESISFPIGKNFFIRQLSEKLRVSADEAISLLNIRSGGKASQSAQEEISIAVELSLKDWSENFHSALASLSLRMNLPRTIFLIINDDLSSIWGKKLKEEEFSQFGMAEEFFDVIIIDNKKLGEKCESDKNSKKEPVLEIECLFLNKLYNIK